MSRSSLLCLTLAALAITAHAQPPQYEIGGPLAGVKLPPFPTQHGETPGYPGWLQAGGDHDGLPPMPQLYPGSVEHWHTYWSKYCPVRSSYDAQSQLRNWLAPNLPGSSPAQVEQYAAPVYRITRHAQYEKTDKVDRPVPVVRFRAGSPAVTLDLGELPVGVYTVRVIGAVPTAQVKPFQRSLFLRAQVNDLPGGGSSVYRQRLGYADEFYSVAEIYFHAPESRRYTMTLQVDEGSVVDLLVHNIDLHDCLAGTVRQAIKTRAVHPPNPGVTPQAAKLIAEQRLARDADIWDKYLPDNVQLGMLPETEGKSDYGEIPGVRPGTDTLIGADIVARYGTWVESTEPGVLLYNKQLDARYTSADLRAGRPLPDPYPIKDTGPGLTFPINDDEGRVWAPIARALARKPNAYVARSYDGGEKWLQSGDSDAARDGAMHLIRFAYSFPAMEDASMLTSILHDPGSFGRGHRTRSRETSAAHWVGHFGWQFRIHEAYDKLFTYIQGNEELAQSVHRFVPSVRTSQDVIALLDTYLVQIHAKRHLRYQYYGDGREPAVVSEIAAVLGDTKVTDPWLDWLFARTFYYPRPLAGLPDYMVGATDRDGRSTIGSASYVMGDASAASIAETVEGYIESGGNPKYNLRDFWRFPKARDTLYFPIRAHSAGLWKMRIGNVAGPDKGYALSWEYVAGKDAALAWRWTKDPQFAYVLKHYGKPADWTTAEWQAIEQAAAGVKRAPWMDNRSRVLSNYAAYLETGQQHDDVRFRRSVMLRVGTGTGHAHADTLDLQVTAHGLPMTVDAGQRPGYSSPNDMRTRVHNTVQVDNQDWPAAHVGGASSFVKTLSDGEGARYMQAEVEPNDLAAASRQVALLDVDEGHGSRPLDAQAFGPKPNLPKDVVTPNSYVFDVFRVAGGSTHTYCFHGGVNDQPEDAPAAQIETNATDVVVFDEARHVKRPAAKVMDDKDAEVPATPEPAARPEYANPAAAYLDGLNGHRYWGTAPTDLVATFHLQKERLAKDRLSNSTALAGSERLFAGSWYDPASPDKATRLHLLGVGGATVMKGDLHCHQWKYFIPNLYVQRTGTNLQTAFAAVIEPYAGTPFIRSVQRLTVPGNESDAQQAVAVQVETVNGHRDLLLADGRPNQTRIVGDATFSGEFGYVSTDADGVRQATLTGGTLLRTPQVTLRADTAERVATITRVDYGARKVWVDRNWGVQSAPGQIELRTMPAERLAWRTSYAAVAVAPQGNGSEITLAESADFYRGAIQGIKGNVVTAALPVPLQASAFRRGWTASDESGRHAWKVSNASGNNFTLQGGAVNQAAFGEAGALRLWEYGVGDQLRQRTWLNLRRVNDGYELTGNVDADVTLPGGKQVKVTAAELAKGAVAVR